MHEISTPVGERYVMITCRCGRSNMLKPSTDPKLFAPTYPEDPNSMELRDDVLGRLRCQECGRRGRPYQVTIGWSGAVPYR